MNTNDTKRADGIAGDWAFPGLNRWPPGLPDPAALARMANKYFAETGGTETQAGDAAPAISQPALAAVSPTNAVPAASAYSFLPETRQLFPEPEPGTAALNPFVQPLGEFIPRELTDVLAPVPAADVPQPPMPAIPGVLGDVGSSVYPAFSFLEEARPLFSYPPAVPGPVPAYQPDAALPKPASYPFDPDVIRRDFPILRERVNGLPLVWLDNAATTQKPQSVIDRLKYFYEHENSNIHRAAHELAARSTDAYEAAREKVRAFLNASSVREIVFVRGATEAINLVAQSGAARISAKTTRSSLAGWNTTPISSRGSNWCGKKAGVSR